MEGTFAIPFAATLTWLALCEVVFDKINWPTGAPDAGDRERP
jgi:hypothetical protein